MVGAMIPWYALQLFPLFTVGTAKVNLLDALAACAVLLAFPAIVRSLRDGDREVLLVCSFIAYMVIPFTIGLHDPGGQFKAIREARAIAFYALALAFVTGRYQPVDFRKFGAAYVAGTTIAVTAVFLHVFTHVALPGYPAGAVRGVRYLEWTVPVVGFVLSLAGALTARSRAAQLPWIGSSIFIAWYALATAERFIQFLTVSIAVILPSLPVFGG